MLSLNEDTRDVIPPRPPAMPASIAASASASATAPDPIEAPPPAADPTLLRWIVGLRWVVFVLLAATLPIGERFFGFHVNYSLALPVISLIAAYNAVAHAHLRAGRPSSTRAVAASVALDLLAIGALLAASGGAANPFSAVFFVHVALAASLLPARTTFALAALAACTFAALFALPSGTCCPNHDPSDGFSAHLYGMWAAFVVAAGLVAYFITRVRRALEERGLEIARLRRQAEEGARFAALGTLAAGTAHELATPLGTIAVLAGEIADQAPPSAEARAQASAIAGQVARCRDVIRKMQAGVAKTKAPAGSLDLRAAVKSAIEAWRKAHPEAPVVLRDDPGALPAVSLESEDVEAAVCALLDNARHATAAARASDPIVVALASEPEGPVVRVEDAGTGVDPHLTSRLGEPFLTTKQPGEGMGMGLYLVRTWLSQAGCRLEISAREPRGTRVTLHLAGARA
jgi:two-component system sensor histidine kinase RegB